MGSQENRDALDRLAIALDTPDWSTYEKWCEQFGPRVGVLKVGLEAFVRWGHEAVDVARRHARRVFLDLKLHDIPNTVRGAVEAARASGVDLLTVHASGGEAMLEAARQAAEDRLAILAVTLLTHLDETALEALDLPGSGLDRVQKWAGVRERSPLPFLLVTPGIRLRASGGRQDDQRRVATPGEALLAGADLLVVGRPVTRARDPEAVLLEISRQMDEALTAI